MGIDQCFVNHFSKGDPLSSYLETVNSETQKPVIACLIGVQLFETLPDGRAGLKFTDAQGRTHEVEVAIPAKDFNFVTLAEAINSVAHRPGIHRAEKLLKTYSTLVDTQGVGYRA